MNKGFTLIEIMIVIVLMSVISSMVMLAIPGGDSMEGNAVDSLTKLMYTMQEITDRASMEGRIIGLKISPTKYEFLHRVKDTSKSVKVKPELIEELKITRWDTLKWGEYTNGDLTTKSDFDENFNVKLEISGLSIETVDTTMNSVDFEALSRSNKKDVPQILFYPSGEVTPFKLTLEYSDSDEYGDTIGRVHLIGSELGRFEVIQE